MCLWAYALIAKVTIGDIRTDSINKRHKLFLIMSVKLDGGEEGGTSL